MACDFCGNESIDVCEPCGRGFCGEHGSNGVCSECADERTEGNEEDLEEQHPNLTET